MKQVELVNIEEQRLDGQSTITSTVDKSILEKKLGFHIRMVDRTMSKGFVQHVGITRVQYAVLSLIASNENLSQTNIGDALYMDRASTMAIINKLQDAGYVSRKKSPHDKRMHALALTAKGKKAFPTIDKKVTKHEDKFLQRLSDDELDILNQALSKLTLR